MLKRIWLVVLLVCANLSAQESELTLPQLQELVTAVATPQDEDLFDALATFPLHEYEIVESPTMGRYLVERDSCDMIKQVLREGWHREGHVVFPLWKYITPGSVVVDIGGHIGTHTTGFSARSGIVHVFEPQIKIFIELVGNMYLNNCQNVVFHRAALGDHQGWVTMNPPCPSNEGGIAVGERGDRAPMLRLDDFNLSNVSVMKIDVEGLEMQVIKGALDTIQRNRPVMAIEIMDEVEQRIQEIRALGYSVVHLGMHDYLFIPV